MGHTSGVPIVTCLAHARVPSVDGVDAYDREWACAAPLEDALTAVHDSDVHITQYAPVEVPDDKGGPPIVVRASRTAIRDGVPISMVVLVGDIDPPEHRAKQVWREEVEAKLRASGLAWYRTRNGARVVCALPELIVLRTEADELEWYGVYLAFVAWARDVHGLALDPKCKEWGRLFRLPNVMRDGRDERAEVHGEITIAPMGDILTYAATNAPSAPATPHAASDDERTTRAHTMATRLPPSVEGCGGDAALFHAACELETICGADRDAIRSALDVFNARCLPPWPASKLDLEASRAAARHDPVVAAYAARLEARVVGAPVDVADDPAVDPWHAFASFTAPEVPLEYVCEGLRLAKSKGKISIIAGYAGTSKGPLADYLAVCFALGVPVFGAHEVKRTRVLVIDEEGLRLTMRRLRRIARGLGHDPAELEGWVLPLDGGLVGDLCDDGAQECLASLIREKQIGAVILDSYTTAMLPSGIDSNTPQYAALASALGQLDVLVLAVAHARKGDARKGPPTLEDISGSGALAALAQTALGVWYPDADDHDVACVRCLRAPEGDFDTFEIQWSGNALADEPLTVVLHEGTPKTVTPRRIEALKTRIADTTRHAERLVEFLSAQDRMGVGVDASKCRSHLGIPQGVWSYVRDDLVRRGVVVESTLPSDSRVTLRLAGDAPLSATRLPQPGEVASRRA